ncbi:tRNA pseudouridine(38-40) synthase TruA [Buchnera aphidicola]|uniref:tRNA pseudouridine synthase A n=1 Tax=Buchnera aphidicola (Stegophylla sp.) TaxID=2315800 RepID=A0A4D6Y9V7_9GAMM|nr:tRNA pseudouridine(38-40) synthase TruA [Buchnera aphidicola (Stegophylla sp.)]QCI26537.1 tRNA pseudouridine(38-40) synthase TruA [Buchnera aphidicola (Stegophylla sp.)]
MKYNVYNFKDKYIKTIKFAIGIEYDGSNYHGWQYQQNGILNIQYELERAISLVADHKVHVICSSRTDAGVHSIGQVVHFYTIAKRKNISWILGINNYLPRDISVQWIKQVCDKFHARYSAISRSYRYVIYNCEYRSSIFRHQTSCLYNTLNIKLMYQASRCLIGEHDFTSFQAKQCQSKIPYRRIIYMNIFQYKMFIFFDIVANSFLHHMVRNIVGCLIQIGIMKKKVGWIQYLLFKQDRSFCAPTSSPSGLYLFSVNYPDYFHIPMRYF